MATFDPANPSAICIPAMVVFPVPPFSRGKIPEYDVAVTPLHVVFVPSVVKYFPVLLA